MQLLTNGKLQKFLTEEMEVQNFNPENLLPRAYQSELLPEFSITKAQLRLLDGNCGDDTRYARFISLIRSLATPEEVAQHDATDDRYELFHHVKERILPYVSMQFTRGLRLRINFDEADLEDVAIGTMGKSLYLVPGVVYQFATKLQFKLLAGHQVWAKPTTQAALCGVQVTQLLQKPSNNLSVAISVLSLTEITPASKIVELAFVRENDEAIKLMKQMERQNDDS